MRTYRQSLVASGSQRRNRNICLTNKGRARKCQQMSRDGRAETKVWMPRIPFSSVGFQLLGVTVVILRSELSLEKLILYLPTIRQSTTPLCCDHRKRDSSLFVSFACTHTSLFLRRNCLSHIQLRKKKTSKNYLRVFCSKKNMNILDSRGLDWIRLGR
jgi:hypothetical protein